MNRRETLLALLALGTATGSPAAFAQQPGKVWRVGRLLHIRKPESLDCRCATGASTFSLDPLAVQTPP